MYKIFTKKELEAFEKATTLEQIPLLQDIYISVSRTKHESGYRHLKIYGINFDKNYYKCISSWSDVIELPNERIRIDALECNVFRLFCSRDKKFKIIWNLSTFKIEVVNNA